MKNIYKIIVGLLLLSAFSNLNAQCPAGQTEVFIEINAVSFGSEIGWELINKTTSTVVACQPAGTYSTGDVTLEGPFCLTNGDSYCIVGYDDFGDDWNGGFFNVVLGEDGSVNGCANQDGCIVLAGGGTNLDVEPDVSVTNSCETSNQEFEVALPVFGCPTAIVGCDDAGALNFNACVTTPDNATCIFPAAGDDCMNPVPICGTIPLVESNISATTVPSDPLTSCIGSLENTVWMSFMSDASGSAITIDITQDAGCPSASSLQTNILSGVDCAGAFTEEDCTSTGPVYNLMIAAPTPNTMYWVYIDGIAGDECGFTVQGGGGIASCCGPEVTLETTCVLGDTSNFYVDIVVTVAGADATGYDVNGGAATITAPGTYTVGPFPNGTTTITIDGNTETCNLSFDVDGDCGCDATAVVVGADQQIMFGESAAVSATLANVVPGGFLGTYTVTEAAAACDVVADNAPVCLALGDDAGSGNIPLGFNFDFFGVTYTDVCVGSNGYVTFTCVDQTDLSEDPFPNTNDPNAIIALFWDDLDPGNGADGTICHFSGTFAGMSCFVVEYAGVPHWPGPPSETVTGQIIICPDGTVVTTCVDCQADNGTESAGQGIEDENGIVGYGFPSSPAGDGISDGSDLTNCVTYVPDVSVDTTCIFLGWATDPTDALGSIVDTNINATLSPSTTTTYYAVVDCAGTICSDSLVIVVDDASIPAMGEWALIVLSLLMLSIGLVAVRRRIYATR